MNQKARGDKTLTKGLAILDVLARRKNPAGVSDIGKELGLTKSNVHRLLQTLQHLEFVRQESGGSRYELTTKIWEISQNYRANFDLLKVSRPYLLDLSEKSDGETVHLSILDGAEVVFVDKVEGSQPIRAYSMIGGRAPAYATATGKALLSAVDPSKMQELIGSFHPFTSKTVKTFEELEQRLSRTRVEGFAINYGEWRDGVGGVAAPIRGSDGHVIAAIGISGPVERLSEDVLEQSGALVIKIASAISFGMGFVS